MSTSKVFIPHEEYVWVTGQIVTDVDAKGDVQVKIQDELLPNETGIRTIQLAKLRLPSLPQQNLEVPNQGVEDMTKLNYLHEPAILDNLKRRFAHEFPYTYTGEVCVAVNPYKWLRVYTDALRLQYSKSTRHELPPHVYATSTDAYRGLTTRMTNQSILVTGESGAGKTETVKILMHHIAFIAGKSDDKTVDKLLKANPLMESFGNAKTARNDNSSRFGKFSQLEFNDLYVLVGSKCVTYLLEKSRVITQTNLERNFHIMYQLLAAPENVKEKLMLQNKKVTDFNYTSSGDTKTSTIEGMSDADRYKQTIQILELLGVGPKLRALLEKAIAGILHMGQINFHQLKGSADASTITVENGKFDEATTACCKMLGVNVETFASCVTTRFIDVEGKKLSVPLSVEQAASGRDALAKEIYSRIFNWLVLLTNFNTSYSANAKDEVKARMVKSEFSTISLLDIFGFECFSHNGFEQFCINFANEKLQQRFTQDVFKTVQKEYQEEGLPWNIIKYKDNQETLDMIEGRLGIIDLLNEECQIPKGTDSNFLTKIKSNFGQHYAFSFDQRSRESFTIRHYAGQVTYNVLGFMDANKDAVPNNLEAMVGTADNSFLKRLFAQTPYFRGDSELLMAEERQMIMNMLHMNLDINEEASKEFEIPRVLDQAGRYESPTRLRAGSVRGRNVGGGGGGFVVSEKILTKFKNQLGSLMEIVNSTDVQYVRCIKPNSHKSSTEYDRRMVVEQLRSAGMIEAVRISRAAFPNRLLYADFMHRFYILRSQKWHDSVMKNLAGQSYQEQQKGATKAFLAWAIPDNTKALNDGTGTTEHYAFGHTKVYFTSYVLEKLENARNNAVYNHVCNIQKVGRGYVVRKRFAAKLAAIRVLGRFVCTAPDRMKLYKMKKALGVLQSICMMLYVRRRYRVHRDAYRKDKDLLKAQLGLERDLNLQKMREKADADRARRAAEADAARQRAIEEKVRAEEEARRAEEERLRLIEEAKRAEEAKLRYYESLEIKAKEDAQTIQELKYNAELAKADIELQKSCALNIQVKLDETLHEYDVAKASEKTLKGQLEQEKTRYRQLDTKLTETLQKIAQLEKADKAMRAEMEELRIKANVLEAKLKTSSERIVILEQKELSNQSQLNEEKERSANLENKIKEYVERQKQSESTERSLKSELEQSKESYTIQESKLKTAESTIATLSKNEILYKETIQSDGTKYDELQKKLNDALTKIKQLEGLEQTVKSLKSENERLQDAVNDLEIANSTIESLRKKESTLKAELSSQAIELQKAQATIEDLEKRPVGPPADGSSVLSGLNDMEIVIDEDKGKMRVIVTKRRQDGNDALGPVEKFVIS